MSCESKLKTEIRKKENAGLMEAWSYAQYAGEREREREREKHRKLYYKTLTQCSVLHVCVFNAHVLYKSLQGLTEVLSYFNALKERLH